MSADMEPAVAADLAATSAASENELSDVEVDGDGSSSLSDIEDKDADPDDGDHILSDATDDAPDNDSEAETERLENSPEKARKHKSVVLDSQSESHTFERSPSKLQNERRAAATADPGDDDPDDALSDAVSLAGSATLDHADDNALGEDTPGQRRRSATTESSLKKRKRSAAGEPESETAADDDEPARKRTGSVIPTRDGSLDAAAQAEDAIHSSHSASGDGSEDEVDGHDEQLATPPELDRDSLPRSGKKDSKKRWKGRRGQTNGASDHDESTSNTEQHEDAGAENGVDADERGEGEADDDHEALLRNEEELKRKRIAMDQLGEIEKHFHTFKEKLFDDRLSHLEQQESMLNQSPPTHPEYLAMLECIIERRDERLRTQQSLMKHQLESLERTAVSKRAQALTQYYQRVRDIRERALERLGIQWYSIQHDRRSYAAGVPDFTIKFPQRRQQQVLHQTAYNKEVSILSGIAKYIGFPAAPPMAAATSSEYEQDLEKMTGRARELSAQRSQLGLPAPTQAAFRASLSSIYNKPAEEQFIEQTPWANPQHPSHIHLLQRQPPPAGRKASPTPPSRRLSQTNGAPVPGTFTKSNAASHSNGPPATNLPQANNSQRGQPHQNSASKSGTPPAVSEQPEGSKEASDTTITNPPRIGTFPGHGAAGNMYETDIQVKKEHPIAATGRF